MARLCPVDSTPIRWAPIETGDEPAGVDGYCETCQVYYSGDTATYTKTDGVYTPV